MIFILVYTVHLSGSVYPEVVNDKISEGALAQLGERLNGIQEVSGSIPLCSTKYN